MRDICNLNGHQVEFFADIPRLGLSTVLVGRKIFLISAHFLPLYFFKNI